MDIDIIKNKILQKLKKPIEDISDLEDFLIRWWCGHYNKPFKCEEIQRYTFEELLYEFYCITYGNDKEKLDKEYQEFLRKKKKEELYQFGIGDGEIEDDEEWLKKEMGDQYQSEEEFKKMQENPDKYAKEEEEALEKEDEEVNIKF